MLIAMRYLVRLSVLICVVVISRVLCVSLLFGVRIVLSVAILCVSGLRLMICRPCLLSVTLRVPRSLAVPVALTSRGSVMRMACLRLLSAV